MQEAAHLQHCGLFISPGNKPEAHGVLSKSGGLEESAVLQGKSQPFTPQRAKAEGQFPPKHTAGNLHIKKKMSMQVSKPTPDPVYLKVWNCRCKEKLLRKY